VCPIANCVPDYLLMNKVPLANFKGLSLDGQREDFAKSLCASLFNDDISNAITFSQIHLAGQNLQSEESGRSMHCVKN
jgi:hypothetical protein